MWHPSHSTAKFIRVRTQFEGYHYYPDAGKVDPRIEFLEHKHRHLFKVEAKIEVHEHNRELEFFLVKWKLQEIIDKFLANTEIKTYSCELIGEYILHGLILEYGGSRIYEITVSEDGESDGIVYYDPLEKT